MSDSPPPSIPEPHCAPLSHHVLSARNAELYAAMCKALANPVRLRLFSRIAAHPNGEACVQEVSDVGVSYPTVSHHLKKLREAGLLHSERRGTWVYYRVDSAVLAALADVLG